MLDTHQVSDKKTTLLTTFIQFLSILTDTFITFYNNKDNCFEYPLLVKLIVKYLLSYIFWLEFTVKLKRYCESFRCGSFKAEDPK